MSNPFFHLIRNAVMGACAMLLLAQGPAAADDALSFILGGANTPPLMNSLNLIAAGAGFYKDEHLNVTTSIVHGPSLAAKMCAYGQGDICPMGIEAGISGYANGDVLKMFLTRASKFGYVIAVLDSSLINTLADLKGKTIGVHSLTGASPILATQSSLATVGLKKGDYTFVAIGMEDAALNLFTSGKVQAAALPLYELIPYMVGGAEAAHLPSCHAGGCGQCRLSRLTRDPDQQARRHCAFFSRHRGGGTADPRQARSCRARPAQGRRPAIHGCGCEAQGGGIRRLAG